MLLDSLSNTAVHQATSTRLTCCAAVVRGVPGAEACAADEDGYTALHWAAAIGTPDVMPRLAAAGVRVVRQCSMADHSVA